MTLSTTQIANLALDELPAQQIVSVNDNNHRAEVCRRQYPQAIGELMEHEWSFATRRAVLVSITNTQSNRWGYAYAVPNGLGLPLRVRETGSWAYDNHVGAGHSLAITGWFSDPGITFDIEGGTLFTNAADVTLEYVTADPAFADMTRSFEKALVFLLASKLAMPITKDEGKADKLMQKADLFWQRALAADLNRNASANTYGNNFIPEMIADSYGGGAAGYTGPPSAFTPPIPFTGTTPASPDADPFDYAALITD